MEKGKYNILNFKLYYIIQGGENIQIYLYRLYNLSTNNKNKDRTKRY